MSQGTFLEDGIFWAPRTLVFASSPYLQFPEAPFTSNWDRQQPYVLSQTLPVGRADKDSSSLIQKKKSNHKNNSGFCQHSIWLLAAKRLFYSLDGWHIFLEKMHAGTHWSGSSWGREFERGIHFIHFLSSSTHTVFNPERSRKTILEQKRRIVHKVPLEDAAAEENSSINSALGSMLLSMLSELAISLPSPAGWEACGVPCGLWC